MGLQNKQGFGWLGNEELIYSMLGSGIVASLIFWPLLNSMICIGMAGYWLAFSKKKFSYSFYKSKWVVLFISLYLAAVTGMFYSEDRSEAFFRLQQKIPFLLFPLVFGTADVATPVLVRRSLTIFTWSTFLGCLYCLLYATYIYFTKGSSVGLYGYGLVVLKDMPPFMLGLFCLFSILFLMDSFYEDRQKGSPIHIVNLSMLIFLSLFLLLLSNRSMLIFFIGTVMYYCFRLIRSIRGRALLLTSLIAIFTAALFLNPSLHRQWNEMFDFSDKNTITLDADESLGRSWGGKTLRVAIWKCSMDIIKSNWLTGVGTGDTQSALQQAYENRKFYFASRHNRYNAHNQYIQETLAHGIIGLFILTSCICFPLVKLYSDKENRLYTLFLCCFAFICITESLLELNKGIIWYSYFNCILLFKNPGTKK
ncbi:MAG: O-antigen ligase family protein [Chitinophagaceae bacterium]